MICEYKSILLTAILSIWSLQGVRFLTSWGRIYSGIAMLCDTLIVVAGITGVRIPWHLLNVL